MSYNSKTKDEGKYNKQIIIPSSLFNSIFCILHHNITYQVTTDSVDSTSYSSNLKFSS